MPRTGSSLPVYIVLATCVFAGPGVSIVRAELRFTATSQDRGEVRAGVPLKETFAFVNVGTEPIQILEVRSTCGCLAPRIEKKLIAPGEKGEVLVEVNTLSQPAGHHNWATRLRYQVNGTAREVLLELIARLTTDVTVQPASLVLFVDQPFTHQVLLTDSRPQTFQISRVLTSTEHVVPRIQPVERGQDGRWSRQIQLDVKGDHPEGRFDQVVSIYTDDPAYPEIRLPITIVKRAHYRLSATPALVTFDLRGGQKTASRLVLVRDEQQEDVLIDRVTADHPALACRWSKEPGKTGSVRISMDRGQLTGKPVEGNVRIFVTKPDHYVLTIPVQCLQD